MWIYFDTFHVIQHPTYMSKYPPAQGAVLAVGELLGQPWIGVLLSVSAMCAATLWMMQGWLPARWALLGAMLVLLRLGSFNYWINSYWGGAVAATGGALVVGALPRLIRAWRSRDAWILGLGAIILANSRPFEGFIFCVPVFIVLIIGLSKAHGSSLRGKITRVMIPICAAGLLCAAFMGYYNWRITGNPVLSPYVLYDQTYMSSHALLWQKTTPPPAYTNPQFAAFDNGMARESWKNGRADSFRNAALVLWRIGIGCVRFFLWPELCVVFLALPWMIRDRRVRFLIVQFVISFCGFSLAAWFGFHYAAPLTATAFTLVAQGLRHVRHWTYQGRAFGVVLTRAVIVAAILLAPYHRKQPGVRDLLNRARIETQLDTMPGSQLVIVRYSPQHDVQSEWVFNRADIDHAKIVWAREIPGVDMHPLLNYFRKRNVWLVDADQRHPELLPYPLAPEH